MKNKLKTLILKYTRLHNGSSAKDIALKVMGELNPTIFSTEEFHEAYEELILDKEIIRLEYSDYYTPNEISTLLFIQGTKFVNLSEIVGEKNEQASQTDMVRTRG